MPPYFTVNVGPRDDPRNFGAVEKKVLDTLKDLEPDLGAKLTDRPGVFEVKTDQGIPLLEV